MAVLATGDGRSVLGTVQGVAALRALAFDRRHNGEAFGAEAVVRLPRRISRRALAQAAMSLRDVVA